jgi:hypothetical protein
MKGMVKIMNNFEELNELFKKVGNLTLKISPELKSKIIEGICAEFNILGIKDDDEFISQIYKSMIELGTDFDITKEQIEQNLSELLKGKIERILNNKNLLKKSIMEGVSDEFFIISYIMKHFGKKESSIYVNENNYKKMLDKMEDCNFEKLILNEFKKKCIEKEKYVKNEYLVDLILDFKECFEDDIELSAIKQISRNHYLFLLSFFKKIIENLMINSSPNFPKDDKSTIEKLAFNFDKMISIYLKEPLEIETLHQGDKEFLSMKDFFDKSYGKNTFKDLNYDAILEFNTKIVSLLGDLLKDDYSNNAEYNYDRALRRFNAILNMSSDIKLKKINSLKIYDDTFKRKSSITLAELIEEMIRDLDFILKPNKYNLSLMEKRILNAIRENLSLLEEGEIFNKNIDKTKPEGKSTDFLYLYKDDFLSLDYLFSLTDEKRTEYIVNEIAKPIVEHNFIVEEKVDETEIIKAIMLLLENKINTSPSRSKNIKIIDNVIRYLHREYSLFTARDKQSAAANSTLSEKLSNNFSYISVDITDVLVQTIWFLYTPQEKVDKSTKNYHNFISKATTSLINLLKLSNQHYHKLIEIMREEDETIPETSTVEELIMKIIGINYWYKKIDREEEVIIKRDLIRSLISHNECYKKEETDKKVFS